MNRFAVLTLRFLLSAWVGAALLFVATSVREQVHPGFPPATKDTLAAIRFPLYYLSGFVSLGLASIASLVMLFYADHITRGRWGIAACTLIALGLMLVDYMFIFSPLLQMMTADEVIRDSQFQHLHELSKWVNMIEVSFVLIAAFLINRLRP